MKDRRSWLFYFVVYTYLTAESIVNFYRPESTIRSYFQSLMVLNNFYVLMYTEHVMNLIFSALAIIPMYLYIFKIPFLSKRVWQIFLIARIFFATTGYMYQYNSWKALAFDDFKLAALNVISFLILLIPSYLACFRYAFDKE